MMRLVVLLLGEADLLPGAEPVAQAYAIAVGEAAQHAAVAAVESLRDAWPQLRLVQHTGGGSFKSQMKKADRSGARVALIWGEDEVANGSVTLKLLRATGTDGETQRTLPQDELEAALRAAFAD